MNELPIACSLSAGDLTTRLEEIRSLGTTALMGHELEQRRAVLHFGAGPETERRLGDIVAAESACCAFLTMRLETRANGITLTIETPPGGESTLSQLARAFTGATA